MLTDGEPTYRFLQDERYLTEGDGLWRYGNAIALLCRKRRSGDVRFKQIRQKLVACVGRVVSLDVSNYRRGVRIPDSVCFPALGFSCRQRHDGRNGKRRAGPQRTRRSASGELHELRRDLRYAPHLVKGPKMKSASSCPIPKVRS